MKTLFICHKNEHPVHLAFAEAIGADIYEQDHNFFSIPKGLLLPKYDVYLVSNPGDIILKKFLHPEIKIIQLIASQFYPRLTLGIPKPLNRREKLLIKKSLESVDGAIAISTFVRDEAAKVLDCPIKISQPFVNDKNYCKLLKIEPDLNSNKIIFIGHKRSNLKIDILIEAFKIAKKQIPDLELCIVGIGHSKELENINGIYVTGWVDNIAPYIEEASLAVFPGYGQSFYLGVIETMLGGLPTIATKYTGAKDAINVKELIREPTVEDIAKGILWYFNLSDNKKKELSKEARKSVIGFDKQTKCNEFLRNFQELKEEV